MNIRNRLPSLYRPEPGDTTLLSLLLGSFGAALDELNEEAGQVMQAHWVRYADRALYDPFFLRQRAEQALPPPDLTKPADRLAVDTFPYLYDLARLASLLGTSPWREPPDQRESVEAFRQRLARLVALYRNGVSTVDALRSMVELQLPVNLSAPPATQDRPFVIEEAAARVPHALAVQMPGEPLALVGPLMRWRIENEGLTPVAPTLYIGGVTPTEGLIDATINPIIELYQVQAQRLRLGIAYNDTLAPDVTLRLRPVFSSWLALETGVQQSISHPTVDGLGDPTAPGPWQAVSDAPAGTVTGIVQTVDKFLWLALIVAGKGELWRYDGQRWEQMLSGLPAIEALAVDGFTFLLGTAEGLRRWTASTTSDAAVETVAELGNDPVYAIYQAQDGQWWVGNESGLWRLVGEGEGATFQPFVLHPSTGNGTPVYAIHQDQLGVFYFGVALGLFQYQPGTDDWYWYAGDSRSEQTPEWQPFHPTASGEARNFPTAARAFLPTVRAIYRGEDAALWLGTEQGLARYIAHPVRGLSYTTRLEAFPDLLSVDETGFVAAIQPDERGQVWFCTARGLLRYDGRDLHQWQSDRWVGLGRGDKRYTPAVEDRGAWRFHRTEERWQRFDPQAGVWQSFTGDLRTTAEIAVRTIQWVDQVVGDLGTWDGATFTPKATDAVVDSAKLQIRWKPTETAIIGGGIPAIPRLPVGVSTWRYLRREEPETPRPEQRPAWTEEGRLLPLPADRLAPPPGRYDQTLPPPASDYDEAVFAFPPAAQLWFTWATAPAFSVVVRLQPAVTDETIDPAILDRVWQGMNQVRPAGVRLALAIGEKVVRD
ncbi:MAG: hypothetical protein DYG89_51500 [Caldilinea sp. CFX5]|nr:hypothetical protein [Caldilinea sp. CFX5]